MPEAGDVGDAERERRESLKDVTRGKPRDLADIPPEEPATILGQALKEQVELKRDYGKWLLRMVGAQLVIADVLFGIIAGLGYDWDVPASVMHVWLAATLIQIVGVVSIVVRSLFGGDDARAALDIARRVPRNE